MQQRDSTKWILYLLTNNNYEVTSTGFVLGGVIDLPAYVVNDRSVLCLNKSYNSNTLYTDSLCMFRCLTYHNYGLVCYKAQSVFSKHVLYNFNTYISFCKKQMFDV